MFNLLFFKKQNWESIDGKLFFDKNKPVCVLSEDKLSYFKSVVPSGSSHDVCSRFCVHFSWLCVEMCVYYHKPDFLAV